MKVGIVYTGVGNVGSILRMLELVGATGNYVTSRKEMSEAPALILPGVGHFDEGVRRLHEADLVGPLTERVCEDKVPILGICLGMQLLCTSSEEGSALGLSLIDAKVEKFHFSSNCGLKVPHMGWNVVRPTVSNHLIPDTGEEQRFYFAHSYRVVPNEASVVIAVANYGSEFCAVFQKEHIFGVQFHPEKSHRFGMALIKRFVDYRAC